MFLSPSDFIEFAVVCGYCVCVCCKKCRKFSVPEKGDGTGPKIFLGKGEVKEFAVKTTTNC